MLSLPFLKDNEYNFAPLVLNRSSIASYRTSRPKLLKSIKGTVWLQSMWLIENVNKILYLFRMS